MNGTLRIVLGGCAAALLACASPAFAEDTTASAPPSPSASQQRMMSGKGMGMHRGMRDHRKMGKHCRMHENFVRIPELPPGNAKLQLEMQGEIMQKVGEILTKYAPQVKEPPMRPHRR